MKLIDKSITDIVSGYDSILRAENELRSRWRPHLLAAYAQRRRILTQEDRNDKRQSLILFFSMLLGTCLFLVGIGLACRGVVQKEGDILWYCCGSPLLALLGLLTLGAAGFSRRNRSRQNTRRVPLHPLRGRHPQSKSIYPDLRQSWMEGLNGGLKHEVPDYPEYRDQTEKDHGAQGERLFIRRLREIFSDEYYVFARLMQRPHEDVDVTLIGPKGVWVFEVKHWSGDIYWNDQGWRREKTYFERGGVEITKQVEVGQPPDEQWIRAAAEVTRTLQLRVPELLENNPTLEKVRGGIVFTKEEAVFKFQPGRPTFWGPLNFWIKTLHEVEPKVVLDRRSALQIAETLLVRHHELAPDGERRSMITFAEGVVRVADEKLAVWVDV